MKLIKKNFLAITVIGIAIIGLWVTNRSVSPRQASWDDVVSEARAGNYKIITTKNLWEKYLDKKNRPLIVDTRQEWEFRAGHVKGAVNFPMEPTWLSRWQKRAVLEKFLGPDKNRSIVFY
ncbi:MAG: rhodanese-like domain-containing protein [Desulfobacteraceae bacterium]|nr:rhodanese-like domain-containing protein [Desulfobacteraceae bacterium]